MKILHIARTVTAYAPARFVNLINKYTEHEAKLIQIRDFHLGNPLNIPLIKASDEIESALEWAEVLHFHGSHYFKRQRIFDNGDRVVSLEKYIKTKPHCLHYHGTPHRERPRKHYVKSCKVLLSTPEMLPIFAKINPVYFPNLIDETSEIYTKRAPKAKGFPKVCHHFSFHSDKKDTDYFYAMTKYVKAHQLNFRCVLIPQMELDRTLYQRSLNDIVFDHCQGYYGLVSTEGLAQGMCVINGANEHTMGKLGEFFGSKPPFICSSRKNLVGDIQKLTHEQINQRGVASMEYMKKVWSGKKNIHRLIDFYKGL